MLVVMQADATPGQIDAVCGAIRDMGFEPVPMPGAQRTAVGLIGNDGQVDGSHQLDPRQVGPDAFRERAGPREVAQDDACRDRGRSAGPGRERQCAW